MSQNDEDKNKSTTAQNEENSEQRTSSSPFRKSAQDKLSSPERLDQLIQVVRPKGWVALIGCCICLIAFVLWAIFGKIPIEIEGRGIILTERGMFGITSSVEGTVKSINTQEGQWVDKDGLIATLDYNGEKKFIVASEKGRIIQLNFSNGDYVYKDSLIGYGEYPLEGDETLVIKAFFPIAEGEKIELGMEGKINVENVDTSEYGYLLAKVSNTSAYSVSDKDILQIVRNQQLANFLKGESISVWGADLIPLRDKLTVSGYAWTTPMGPHQYLKSGSICLIKITVKEKRPISYIFPIFIENKEKPLGANPNIFPEKIGASP
jgi:hypothetical protein